MRPLPEVVNRLTGAPGGVASDIQLIYDVSKCGAHIVAVSEDIQPAVARFRHAAAAAGGRWVRLYIC